MKSLLATYFVRAELGFNFIDNGIERKINYTDQKTNKGSHLIKPVYNKIIIFDS